MFVSGVKDILSTLLAGFSSACSDGRVQTDAPCENQYRKVGFSSLTVASEKRFFRTNHADSV
jgi:hypothetical protein